MPNHNPIRSFVSANARRASGRSTVRSSTFEEASTPKARGWRHIRAGFTLIELLTVIAIIGILAGILIPVVGRVRESARSSQSVSNIRQISLGVQLYSNDFGFFPGTNPDENPNFQFWGHEIEPYVAPIHPYSETGGDSIWFAPNLLTRHGEINGNNLTGYGMNKWLYTMAGSGGLPGRIPVEMVLNPSQKSMIMETLYVAGGNFDALPANYRFNAWRGHSPGNEEDLNVGFVDGHVERLSIDTILSHGDESEFWGVLRRQQ